MASTPVDKLSRGLARQEIRRLTRVSCREDGTPRFITEAFNVFDKALGKDKGKSKRLTEQAVKMISKKISGLTREIGTVASKTEPLVVTGVNQPLSFETGLYFQPFDITLRPNEEEEKVFDENLIELRYFRYHIGRRRQIIDDIATGFSINEHALARMIERKACNDNPLSCIIDNIDRFIAYAVLFIRCEDTPIDKLMMPLGAGALMSITMTSRREDTILHACRRVLFDWTGNGFLPSPIPYALSDGPNLYSIRASTYVPDSLMTLDQRWCKAALAALLRDHNARIPDLIRVVTHPEEMTRYSPEVAPVFEDMRLIVNSAFWKRAFVEGK